MATEDVFDETTLQDLYGTLSSEGVACRELPRLLSRYFNRPRSESDLNRYRLGQRPWKKLRDEVVPASRFLEIKGLAGRVLFPLDSDIPDAWIEPNASHRIGLEVTKALGRSDYELSAEMIEHRIRRGFLGLQDNAPKAEFEAKLSRRRSMYSSPQAIGTVHEGILRCLRAKNKLDYSGMWLLIVAPIDLVPQERWADQSAQLVASASELPFSEVHVLSQERTSQFILTLKDQK